MTPLVRVAEASVEPGVVGGEEPEDESSVDAKSCCGLGSTVDLGTGGSSAE